MLWLTRKFGQAILIGEHRLLVTGRSRKEAHATLDGHPLKFVRYQETAIPLDDHLLRIIADFHGKEIKLGISAPRGVKILREEIRLREEATHA